MNNSQNELIERLLSGKVEENIDHGGPKFAMEPKDPKDYIIMDIFKDTTFGADRLEKQLSWIRQILNDDGTYNEDKFKEYIDAVGELYTNKKATNTRTVVNRLIKKLNEMGGNYKISQLTGKLLTPKMKEKEDKAAEPTKDILKEQIERTTALGRSPSPTSPKISKHKEHPLERSISVGKQIEEHKDDNDAPRSQITRKLKIPTGDEFRKHFTKEGLEALRKKTPQSQLELLMTLNETNEDPKISRKGTTVYNNRKAIIEEELKRVRELVAEENKELAIKQEKTTMKEESKANAKKKAKANKKQKTEAEELLHPSDNYDIDFDADVQKMTVPELKKLRHDIAYNLDIYENDATRRKKIDDIFLKDKQIISDEGYKDSRYSERLANKFLEVDHELKRREHPDKYPKYKKYDRGTHNNKLIEKLRELPSTQEKYNYIKKENDKLYNKAWSNYAKEKYTDPSKAIAKQIRYKYKSNNASVKKLVIKSDLERELRKQQEEERKRKEAEELQAKLDAPTPSPTPSPTPTPPPEEEHKEEHKEEEKPKDEPMKIEDLKTDTDKKQDEEIKDIKIELKDLKKSIYETQNQTTQRSSSVVKSPTRKRRNSVTEEPMTPARELENDLKQERKAGLMEKMKGNTIGFIRSLFTKNKEAVEAINSSPPAERLQTWEALKKFNEENTKEKNKKSKHYIQSRNSIEAEILKAKEEVSGIRSPEIYKLQNDIGMLDTAKLQKDSGLSKIDTGAPTERKKNVPTLVKDAGGDVNVRATIDKMLRELDNKVMAGLSYWNNPEIVQDTVEIRKDHRGKNITIDSLDKRRKYLVLPHLSQYVQYLMYLKKKLHVLDDDEFRAEKVAMIDYLNSRYFGDGNEYGWKVQNSRGGSIKFTNIKKGRDETRVEKGYVNQNAPNKDTFFSYNMGDLYHFIEEYISDNEDYKFSLSEHAKNSLEAIVNSEVERFKKSADAKGEVTHHTIAHGFDNKVIIKFIENYINQRKNPHIKSKFYLSSEGRDKIIEIIENETKKYNHGLNEYILKNKLKTSNILDRMSNMIF